ncbi:MAG TPA: hypothetical protein VIJ93_11470 [bacterium]
MKPDIGFGSCHDFSGRNIQGVATAHQERRKASHFLPQMNGMKVINQKLQTILLSLTAKTGFVLFGLYLWSSHSSVAKILFLIFVFLGELGALGGEMVFVNAS